MSLVPGFSTHSELRMLTENGFSPYEALVTATREAGVVAGRMTGVNNFGTIETGKRADLILLAANPLEKIENVQDPLGVMVRGHWLPSDTLQTLLTIKTTKITDLLSAAYSQGGIETAIARYDHIVNHNFDNRYYYSSATLNTIGYNLLNAGLVDDALRVFELNTKEYPEDWNVFDSCGEALMKAGKTDLAIRSYERARAIGPSQEHPLQMLRELRGPKN
jgi:tetratricopeptide (TPR) repeat protein